MSDQRETSKLVCVYVEQGQLRAHVIKARLESEGIPAVLRYESASIVFGITVDGLGEVEVLVPERLADEARAVLAVTVEASD